jgi:hypothetical protein
LSLVRKQYNTVSSCTLCMIHRCKTTCIVITLLAYLFHTVLSLISPVLLSRVYIGIMCHSNLLLRINERFKTCFNNNRAFSVWHHNNVVFQIIYAFFRPAATCGCIAVYLISCLYYYLFSSTIDLYLQHSIIGLTDYTTRLDT